MRRLLPREFPADPERALTAETFRGFDSRRLHSSPEVRCASRSMMTSGDFVSLIRCGISRDGESPPRRETFD
jgi:hypothetical protein